MKDPIEWARAATRKDLQDLGRGLKNNWLRDDERDAVLDELQRVAPSRCGRFQARVRKLVEDFGRKDGSAEAKPRSSAPVTPTSRAFLERLLEPGATASEEIRETARRLLAIPPRETQAESPAMQEIRG